MTASHDHLTGLCAFAAVLVGAVQRHDPGAADEAALQLSGWLELLPADDRQAIERELARLVDLGACSVADARSARHVFGAVSERLRLVGAPAASSTEPGGLF